MAEQNAGIGDANEKLIESIKKLSSGQNRLVIISHRGRPEGFDKNLSLKRMHKLLQKKLGKSIKFFGHFGFRKIKAEIGKSAPGSVFMLENIRFLPGEIRNDSGLAKQLASLGDVFVNDDFATAHRENASNVGIAKYIKHQIGPNLKRELDSIGVRYYNPNGTKRNSETEYEIDLRQIKLVYDSES